MMPGTVLVTGASGFVGPHLVRALVAAGARVAGLGIEPAPPPGVPLDGWSASDVRQPEALAEAVARTRPDAVVHLAGQSSTAHSLADPAGTFQINVLGTWSLLEAVRREAPRARVVVVGSGEAYGPQAPGTRVAEDAPFAPLTPYALSKAAADFVSETHARAHGLDVVRVRAFSHTGPGQSQDFVVPAFASQIARIEAGRAEPVLRVGNLEVTRDLSDARDVARAYVALLERGVRGVAYNVCRGEGVRLAEVARLLVARAKVAIGVVADPARFRPADVPWLVGDPTRIRAAIGWRAETPLEQTLADVLAEWRDRTETPR